VERSCPVHYTADQAARRRPAVGVQGPARQRLGQTRASRRANLLSGSRDRTWKSPACRRFRRPLPVAAYWQPRCSNCP